VLFSFRVALPDRPGALAQLTALIASHRIDVRAVDVLGGKMTEAVDQFLLDGDSDHVEALADDLRDGGVFTLLGIRRAGIMRDDLPELAVVQAVAKDVDRALDIVTHAAPRLCDADWAIGFEAGLPHWQARTPSAPRGAVERPGADAVEPGRGGHVHAARRNAGQPGHGADPRGRSGGDRPGRRDAVSRHRDPAPSTTHDDD
jgi:hypothetical protein